MKGQGMAKICRIDNATVDAAGKFVVQYTASNGILGQPSGQTFVYDSLEDFRARMQAFEESITDEQLMFLAASQWLKLDGQLVNKALAKNKSAQLDLTGNAAVIKLT